MIRILETGPQVLSLGLAGRLVKPTFAALDRFSLHQVDASSLCSLLAY
jgi:hypothetical protein